MASFAFVQVASAQTQPAPRSMMDRLLSMRELSFGMDGTEVQFARNIPPYGWAMVIFFVVLFSAWSYFRLSGSKGARVVLAGLRSLAILLLIVLACGPQLVKQNERIERDWVVVLADRSASMSVQDVAKGNGTRGSREEQLRDALRAAQKPLTELSEKRNILALGFDAGVFDIPTSRANGDSGFSLSLQDPEGKRTALGTSLAQALQRVAARPIAGIVLLSDGRSFDAPSRELLNQFAERQIPIFPVPLGSPNALVDLAVTRVNAPQSAFLGDLVPVTVDVEALGADENSRISGKVQLLDANGNVLSERPLPTDATSARVTLNAKPENATGEKPDAGKTHVTDWSVRLVTDDPDLTSDNNTQSLRLELVDRPIRVLYVDGYPRWEFRYVKNLLLREQSIRSTIMQLAAEKRFIQEGTDRIEFLPRTVQEWSAFDVVMLGDVRPSLMSEEQLRALRDAVSQRGVGLLWIGGPSYTPAAWRATPLSDVLPFVMTPQSASGSPIEVSSSPVLMEPGPAASGYGVLQLADASSDPTNTQTWPENLSNPTLGWSKLQWSQVIDTRTLKPAAEVLANARSVSGATPAATTNPLVMTMRYGSGRCVYVGTDETWRYRYGRGETLTERFWIPIVRLLARGSLGRSGKPALLEAAPERALVNQPVRVVVRLLDQSLLDQRPVSIRVNIAPQVDNAQSNEVPKEQLVLQPESNSTEPGAVATYAGLWVPSGPGTFEIVPTEPMLAGLGLSARVEAQLPEDELRRPQTDHPALAQLAEATGGQVVQPDALASLTKLLPNREVRLMGTPQVETLWDKPLALLGLMLLLVLEWVGRRWIKLS
ncbi:MAG: hypothetical protein U0640_02495 [Phycisphaerales bacterium]